MRRLTTLLPVLALAVAPAACLDAGTSEDDLTSNTALARSLRFDGYVYVEVDASDYQILDAVKEQTQTAFGALRTAEIGVNNRELALVDVATFKRTTVNVIDTSDPALPSRQLMKVKYRYKDTAVVPKEMASRSAITLAVMNPGYQSQQDRVLEQCTENDEEAHEFADTLWYVFDPSLGTCQDAIAAEQKAIDAEKEKLPNATNTVSEAEVARLYLPTTVSLGADKTNKGTSYPEYHRLYAGGVKPGRLVIGLVNGFLDHDLAAGAVDSGFVEWMEELREAMKSGAHFKLVKSDPPVDVSKFTVSGKTYSGITFEQIQKWAIDGTGYPAGLTTSGKKTILKLAADKLSKTWLTFEAPLEVKIGSEAKKPVTIEINTYFGASDSPTPHKKAIKNSDVFIYNGHSYIGYGPLDPSNFTAADFPPSYQILFFDSCVSYNYYEKDFIPLKEGGTKNLELVTNGLEAPAWKSGYALGRFLATLIDGKQESYKSLLAAAEDTDSLRVVDGEVDNKYKPSTKPIVVTFLP